MTLSAAVITTFPNHSWEVYSKSMLTSFVQHWPSEIPILVCLDNDLLGPDVHKIIREQDAVSTVWLPEHKDFVKRNKSKDDPTDYRKQAVRFCHKVFAIKQALNAIEAMPDSKPRYLIWMDADVLTTRKVTIAEIERCLPKEGDAVAYLGRKDWDHSECGWLAFDLENNRGISYITYVYNNYVKDKIFDMEQWHDSWVWDNALKISAENSSDPNHSFSIWQGTNLTQDKPGMEIWPHSPMSAWSRHYKGPVAKEELVGKPNIGGHAPVSTSQGNLYIQTKNSIPDENIQRHILENQAQITNWLRECIKTDEEIVVVSAGPMLIAEDLDEEVKAGRKIIAVKHALEPLKEAGIKPWACILLDPRDHLMKFVEVPDKDVLWFVASQVDPRVVRKLLDSGCNVWGYHAAVGAEEGHLTSRQPFSVVTGGSATATRGLYLLNMLGFKRFRLYGYDLCFPDKPNMEEKDDQGQMKYFEISLNAHTPNYNQKRAFWSKPELVAQYQEMSQIISNMPWQFSAFGQGIIPFMVNAKRVSDLREKRKKDKIQMKPVTYKELLNGRPSRSDCTSDSPARGRSTARNPRRARPS